MQQIRDEALLDGGQHPFQPVGAEQRLILEEFKGQFFDRARELNRCVEFANVPVEALLHVVIEGAVAQFRQPPLSAQFRDDILLPELVSILVPKQRGNKYDSYGLPL